MNSNAYNLYNNIIIIIIITKNKNIPCRIQKKMINEINEELIELITIEH